MAVENMLKQKKVRQTQTRAALLKVFFDNRFALSYNDLNKLTKGIFDKVTIYRTLATFEKKGVIHQVMDTQGIVKYSLCHADCADHHNDNHIHFKCTECDKTFCIENIQIPDFQLPNGYRAHNAEVLMTGICSNC